MFSPLAERIKAHPLIYATKDIERALGAEPSGGYFVLSSAGQYSDDIRKKYPENVFLLDNPANNTLSLLRHPSAKEIFDKQKAVNVVFFKNSRLLEEEAEKHGWRALNPRASLSEKIENKITQTKWLGQMAEEYLPPHETCPAKNIRWKNKPMVIQWAHGHTGDGTTLVNSSKELKNLIEKFPEREARSSDFIKGPSFTANVVVSKTKTLIGNISYQLTGLAPFTDNPWSTVGNDWSLTHDLLSEDDMAFTNAMICKIADRMRTDGWRGLFGVDFIRDEERNRIFLIEINARQPASTSFESQIQEKMRQSADELTVFEAHLLALLDEEITGELIAINDGAQVIQRITSGVKTIGDKKIGALQSAGYFAIPYQNTENNADLIRIQSEKGIMKSHGKLNERGEKIAEILLK